MEAIAKQLAQGNTMGTLIERRNYYAQQMVTNPTEDAVKGLKYFALAIEMKKGGQK